MSHFPPHTGGKCDINAASFPSVPARLRPTAPIAAEAILVGDPGRALMLAQAVLAEPKMCNHARGLWGYTGRTAAGGELTIQSTGMGGPSAGLVLADLAELGVRRAVRVGTCTAIDPELQLGALVVASGARSGDGESGAASEQALPDRELLDGLRTDLGEAAVARAVLSLDTLHGAARSIPTGRGEVADMQTATLLRRGRELGVAIAAVLIVTETEAGDRIGPEEEELAAKLAGDAAANLLQPSTKPESNPQP
jgi:uridine phosphorylase